MGWHPDRFLTDLDVAKVTRTICDVLAASLAFEVPIDRTEARVAQTADFRPLIALFEGLGKLDFGNAHSFDLFGRQDTELDGLDTSQRRTRVRKSMQRHLEPFLSLRWLDFRCPFAGLKPPTELRRQLRAGLETSESRLLRGASCSRFTFAVLLHPRHLFHRCLAPSPAVPARLLPESPCFSPIPAFPACLERYQCLLKAV